MSFDKIIYRLTDKRIPAVTGIGLVGDILERADFQSRFSNIESLGKRSKKQIDTGIILMTYIALLCMGKPDFESVAELQNDAAFYQTALHMKKGFPSAATLRQRMDSIGALQREALLSFNTHLLKSNGIVPTPLKIGMIPVDMDVTPMDNSNTKKEGVSWTNKKYMGYAQMRTQITHNYNIITFQFRYSVFTPLSSKNTRRLLSTLFSNSGHSSLCFFTSKTFTLACIHGFLFIGMTHFKYCSIYSRRAGF